MRLYLSFVFLSFYFVSISQNNTEIINVKGQVIDCKNKKGIPFATLYIPELEKGTVCNINGYFKLSIKYLEQINIKISSLGYAVKDTLIDTRKDYLKICLNVHSIALKEFCVSANYTENSGSNAEIDEKTLEYIQPTSITDVFLLLPGGRISSNNIQGRSLVYSRQAGSDHSTSFGMGISIDGIPIHNDAKRVQMAAYTGKIAIDRTNNLSVNSGVDLRTISTDHIQKITISRGIASAKEGNLSSALIKITSKKGKSPFRVRIKSDPLNQLAYIGKGFLLSEKLGTLHLGADITKSAADLRDLKSAYKRITAQANYDNQFYIYDKNVNFNFRTSYIKSFNNNKTDELIEFSNESYKTKYDKISFSSKLLASFDYWFASNSEFTMSFDYSKDILYHEKYVQNPTVMGIQISDKEGENEGEYLPSAYFTNYTIENKPINFFGSLSATKSAQFSDKFNYKFLYGNSLTFIKNIGKGAIVNRRKPPFPSNRFIRARENYKIPAIITNASYAELTLRYQNKKNKVNLSLGLRGTKMLNLPRHYKLREKYLIEPRIGIAYTFRKNIATNKVFSNTIRLGFGIENKLPSIDYLYPDNEYQDFIMLNAYFANNPEKRLLITNTVINKTTNAEIRENKNKKIEVGWDMKYEKFAISFSVFAEVMNGGIEYFSQYKPISYRYYHKLKYPVTEKPTKDDFESYLVKEFTFYRKPNNSSKIIKKGIEYRINIPKIDKIKSDVQINGAYYHTLYTSGVPVMFRPSTTQNNKAYPYVGMYGGFDKNYRQYFNTNIWINTHLPKLKLIFTNFIQIVWFETRRLGKNVHIYPQKYLDLDGNIVDFNLADIKKNPLLKDLKRKFSSPKYNQEIKPISILMNLKLTKEFNHHVKLSFFANNIIQYNSEYKTAFLKTYKNWYAPFFGLELIVNL